MKAGKEKAATMSVYAQRRKALVELLRKRPEGENSVAILFSGEEESLVPFLPDTDFYYFTGVASPKAALMIHLTPQKSDEVLFLPAPDPAAERWTGKVITSGSLTRPNAEPDAERRDAMKSTQCATIAAHYQLEDALIRPLRAARTLYLDFPEDAFQAPIGQSQLFWEKVRARYPFLELRHLGRISGGLRRVKGAEEIAAMRQAIAITAEANGAITRHLRPGLHEFELQALIEYVFRSRGAEGLAFPSIIGSGPYSCILHYDKNRRRMKAGDMVVCDIGARKDLYCADVTRTYPVSGRFSKRQRQVYEAVLDARRAALEACRPGAFVHQVHKAASDAIAEAGFSKYFFHGTSHYLGLDAHDKGSYDEPLVPGVVITIEPGIYIAEENLGVRIEDDVVITKSGYDVMTKDIPREAGEIEKLMAAPRRVIVY